jgi:hypothetical protein
LGFFGLFFGLMVLVLQPSCRISDALDGAELETGTPPGEYRQIPGWVGVASIGSGVLLLAAARRRR